MRYIKGMEWQSFFQLENIKIIPIVYGIEFGIIYAFFCLIMLKAPVFKTIPLPIDKLIKNLDLNYFDAVFLSLCAGIGEELLFRAGMQPFFGVWATSLFFIAIHGYFSVKKIKMSLYGLLVLPFIVLISFGFDHFGLWFCIAAHFSYDLVLFIVMISEEEK